jgi:hypothetical protein
MTLTRPALGALAGTVLAAVLAGCSGGSTDTHRTAYAPAASGGAPVSSPGTPVASAGAAVPAQGPTDFSALARRFVALRNQGTRSLTAIRGQASSSDLAADKTVLAQAATIFGNYATQLRALPFPPSMVNDANALAQAVSVMQAGFVQASQVSSFDQLDPILQKLVDAQDNELAATNVVEKDLALPLSTPQP